MSTIIEEMARAMHAAFENAPDHEVEDLDLARAAAAVVAKRLREAIEDQGDMLGMENARRLLGELEAP